MFPCEIIIFSGENRKMFGSIEFRKFSTRGKIQSIDSNLNRFLLLFRTMTSMIQKMMTTMKVMKKEKKIRTHWTQMMISVVTTQMNCSKQTMSSCVNMKRLDFFRYEKSINQNRIFIFSWRFLEQRISGDLPWKVAWWISVDAIISLTKQQAMPIGNLCLQQQKEDQKIPWHWI